MNLLDYIKNIPADEREAFALRSGTSLGYLMLVAYGHKKCGESLAINIDRESGGEVPCEELRDDVDWAHLRNRDKVKRIPNQRKTDPK